MGKRQTSRLSEIGSGPVDWSRSKVGACLDAISFPPIDVTDGNALSVRATSPLGPGVQAVPRRFDVNARINRKADKVLKAKTKD